VLAFPFMAEVPMMFYNKALYKKAGLPTNAPARTWAQLQDQLLALRDVAQVKCPYASGDQVAVHLENLAPINNQLYASNGNGMGLSRQPLPVALQFNSLYMRHVSLMATWKRALLLQQDSAEHKAKEMFASGQCGVLTARSGVLGQFRNAKSLSFGVAPLPYYTQATQQPGRPFVSGSALWALAGHPAAQEKATAAFLGWLAKPVIAAAWHQNTGYLPLTEAAFRASDVSFYKKIPGALEVVATMRQQPAANTRGFRMKNYPNIETVLHQGLSDAIDGKVPTMVALNKAASQALLLMAQKPPPRLVSRR
jgi:multiple sugar transport system substrate-binding protein